MKLSALLLSVSLIIGLNLSAYAQDKSHSSLTSAEKSTLATIAAIDQNEILVGVVAENKNAGSAVNDFAKMMIDQHGDNLTQIFNMEGQFKTGPLSSSEADSLSKEGKKDLAKLGPCKEMNLLKPMQMPWSKVTKLL